MQGLSRATGLALVLGVVGLAASSSTPQTKTSTNRGDIERGRYLVEEVAKCSECHTPRNDRGELIEGAWLQGAPIWIQPSKPMKDWADHAPALAGFPGMSEEQGERVLEKGVGLDGTPIRPPMHVYHMNHEDARAIIAYLNSLRAPR